MPFHPLPTKFLDLLDELSENGGVILDFGCGDGSFARMLDSKSLNIFGLDRLSLSETENLHLLGDVLAPPLFPHSIDLIIVANVVRHLLPQFPDANFLELWQGLLKPGGKLIIFEDEPAGEPAPVRNFRDLQYFLAQLMGTGRGPLISYRHFKELPPVANNKSLWQINLEKNQLSADKNAVMAFLSGYAGVIPGEVKRLMAGIEENGLEYGQFWWAQWEMVSTNV